MSSLSIGDNVNSQIKKDIIYGVLEPGSKLKLHELKSKYSVSVSTLRETLNSLASEGFVIAEKQKGFYVTPVSREDLIEIADLRIVLENYAMKISIENGDTEWEANLVAAFHKLSSLEKRRMDGITNKDENRKQYDWEFHQAVIKACNSKNLMSLHSILFDKYLRYQLLVLTYRGESAVQEHKDIFEAALDRDVSRAQKSLTQHIRLGLEHTLKNMKKLQKL